MRTEWLIKYRTIELRNKSNTTIIVHLRRGDYKVNQKNLGILSEKYYERILHVLKDFYPEAIIKIFTNEIRNDKFEKDLFYKCRYRFCSINTKIKQSIKCSEDC